MAKAKSLIKTQEVIKAPKGERSSLALKLFIVVFMLAMYVVIFTSVEWGIKAFLIGVTLGVYPYRKLEKVPSPLEIVFYDSYLKVIHEKRYSRLTGFYLEEDRFRYSDIKEISYYDHIRTLYIIGKVDKEERRYFKDGTVSLTPVYQNISENYICDIILNGDDWEYIVKQLKDFTGIEPEVFEMKD